MNWEDFKKTIKEKPWILGLLAVGIIITLYLVLRKPKNGQYESVPVLASEGGLPAGRGGSDAGLTDYTLSRFVETQKEGLQQITESMQNMLTGFTRAQAEILAGMAESQEAAIKDMMAGMAAGQEKLMAAISQSQKDLLGQMQSALSEFQAVKAAMTKEQQPSGYALPVAAISGGVGGGYAVTETKEQMLELISGGSRNVGGSYSLDYRGWEPAAKSSSSARSSVSKVTGKTGTIESQLSGMTQAQKLETLKKAGLIN